MFLKHAQLSTTTCTGSAVRLETFFFFFLAMGLDCSFTHPQICGNERVRLCCGQRLHGLVTACCMLPSPCTVVMRCECMRGPLKCVELGLLGVEVNPTGKHADTTMLGIKKKMMKGRVQYMWVRERGNNNNSHPHSELRGWPGL